MQNRAMANERPAMDEIVAGLATTSAKIRALDQAGYSRSEIREYLDIRPQHVRTVLVGAKPEPPSPVVWLKLGRGGRIVVPAAYREAIGIEEGDDVQVRLEGDEVHIISRATAVRRAQDIVARYAKDDTSWVDKLIGERRREAAREDVGE